MCGIHGILWNNLDTVQKMIKVSHNRGPDGHGYYDDENITLGHNLLAITEQTEQSIQPWVVGDRNFVLCFNGEIYNYLDLKLELEQAGIKFQTNTDTEVLAAGLLREGIDFLDKLDGMYGISWYNKQEGTVTLARDVSGTKPIYYTELNGKLAFSSDVKALLEIGAERKIDTFAFSLFREFGFVPGPLTLVKNVHKLVPGEVIKFRVSDSSVALKRNLNNSFQFNSKTFDAEEFRSVTNESVKLCLMGRRPIGLYLSGGLDSSMILHELCAYDNKPKTFTTRFETSDHNKYNNDADMAMKLSKDYNTEHTELLITQDSFIDAIDKCAIAAEEPRYNQSTPAYYLLNEKVSQSGVVVTLSGDGGDELLAGYPRHEVVKKQKVGDSYAARREVSILFPYITNLDWYDINDPVCLWHYVTCFKRKPRIMRDDSLELDLKQCIDYMHSWLPKDGLTSDKLNTHMFIESLNHLPEDFLIRNDKLGMNFSMEARFPLLTRKFKEYSFSLSSDQKLQPNLGSKCTSRIAYKGHLPDYIMDKHKTGWTAPTLDWVDLKKFPRRATTPLGRRITSTLSQGWHPGTDELFNFSKMYFPKAIYSTFYFRTWAKEWGMSI